MCYEDACRAPETVPCEEGDDAHCVEAGFMCYEDFCKNPWEVACEDGGEYCENGGCAGGVCIPPTLDDPCEHITCDEGEICILGVCEELVPPSIIDFSPKRGSFGTLLTIEGEDFGEAPSVTLNGVAVELVSVNTSSSPNEITVLVPKNKNCTGPVYVTVNDQTVASATPFTYELTSGVSTLAGDGDSGFRDGAGDQAQFHSPFDIAIDADGNLYVVDTGNHRIRKVTPDGEVSTLAGDGTTSLRDGPLEEARFSWPFGITMDEEGNLFLMDYGNGYIRKISLEEEMVSSFVSASGYGLTMGTDGNLYVAHYVEHRILKITPDGTISPFVGSGTPGFVDGTGSAAQFYSPQDITSDAEGNLYVADSFNHSIRKITLAGEVTTLAGSGTMGFADGTGSAAQFYSPRGLATDAAGTLYVADTSNHRIRMVTPDGEVSTLAGSGERGFAEGINSEAQFSGPQGITIGIDGNLYVADSENNRIRKITLE